MPPLAGRASGAAVKREPWLAGDSVGEERAAGNVPGAGGWSGGWGTEALSRYPTCRIAAFHPQSQPPNDDNATSFLRRRQACALWMEDLQVPTSPQGAGASSARLGGPNGGGMHRFRGDRHPLVSGRLPVPPPAPPSPPPRPSARRHVALPFGKSRRRVIPEGGQGGRVRHASGGGGPEFTASGVPRETHGPGDLAFPQISAPARPPHPACPPSEISAEEDLRGCHPHDTMASSCVRTRSALGLAPGVAGPSRAAARAGAGAAGAPRRRSAVFCRATASPAAAQDRAQDKKVGGPLAAGRGPCPPPPPPPPPPAPRRRAAPPVPRPSWKLPPPTPAAGRRDAPGKRDMARPGEPPDLPCWGRA